MRFASVVLLSLLCSVTLGVLAPVMLFNLVGYVDADASDKWDDVYFFPLLCTLYIAGPMAAGAAAHLSSRKLLARFPGELPATHNSDGCLANVAGIMAVALSWLFVATGWIYALLEGLSP